MPSGKRKIAHLLAQYHFNAEPNLRAIFVLEPLGSDDDDEPVKLLEVVDGSVAKDTFAVGFAPDPGAGIPYRSVVVEISPRELPELKDRGFLMIRGRKWKIGEEVVRDPVAA
jgi:hypothetical protein